MIYYIYLYIQRSLNENGHWIQLFIIIEVIEDDITLQNGFAVQFFLR